MTFQNIENNEDQILHNRFTAYLLVAVKRKKAEYRAKQMKNALHEQVVEMGGEFRPERRMCRRHIG